MSSPTFSLELRVTTNTSEWRKLPKLADSEKPSKLVVTRVRDARPDKQELTASCPAEFYTLGMSLIGASMTFFVNGRQVFSGVTRPGAMHIARPGDGIRVIKSGPTDLHHMFLPVPLVTQLLDESELKLSTSGLELKQSSDFRPDKQILGLFHALALSQEEASPLNRLQAEGLSIAIIAALLQTHSNRSVPPESLKRHGLAGWQVRRVQDFIQAHIAEPLSLQVLANVLNLSRMHFAGQFLRATGLRPHEYLLQERIRKAQQLLMSSSTPLIQIALMVGFETQSHFSTVFKRFAGESPAQWRSSRKS